MNKSATPGAVRAQSLAASDGIRHAFFTREGGVSDGVYASLNAGIGSNDAPELVAENRARMAAAVGVAPARLLTAYQIHSPTVVVAETPWRSEARPRADAIVTRTAELGIGVSTADCGPVLLADTRARVIGAAHAGWRGALAGVVEATVEAMEALGAQRAHINAALGPMIQQANYEVGVDVIDLFRSADGASERFFAPSGRPGHALFDLASFIVSRLEAARVGQVENLGYCTYADPGRFYSYRRTTHRRETDYGRHISAIALAD
jgi:YfiH family protein